MVLLTGRNCRQHVLQTKSFKIEIIQSQSYSNLSKVYEYLKFRFWPLAIWVKAYWLFFYKTNLKNNYRVRNGLSFNRNKTIFYISLTNTQRKRIDRLEIIAKRGIMARLNYNT